MMRWNIRRSLLWGGPVCAWLATISVPAEAAIKVDGSLDEPEWREARSFDGFKTTRPYSLAIPDAGMATQARLVSTPEGIAVAFILTQSSSIRRVKPRLERDLERDADRVTFAIDFDADGRTAYSFTVGLSGSIRDEIVSDERQLSSDWDTDWTSAVLESAEGWQIEMLIPWTVASMRGVDTQSRTVAVYFGRQQGSNSQWQAFPAVSTERGQFVSAFERIEIPQYRTALLHFWPYVTSRYDLLERENDMNGGADLFWKPSPQFQLSATLNPDFGQIESDDLVVNFDAIETFFSDKRPFFTENQSIFDQRTPDEGRLIHTRRIGAEADDGSGPSDIDGAVKLNGSAGALSYGVLAASEAESAGRDYYAARLQYSVSSRLSLGWLGTLTERPFLERTAQVQAVDMRWKPSSNLIARAQILASFIDQEQMSAEGAGGWLRVLWTPSAQWSYEVEATHFGRELDFNDLGFQRRKSLNEIELTAEYLHRPRAANSPLLSSRWNAELAMRGNDSGDRLPVELEFNNTLTFSSGYRLDLGAVAISSGWDDLISRGNGLLRLSSRYSFEAELIGPRRGNWQLGTYFALEPEGLSSAPGRIVALTAKWYPSDIFNAALEIGPEWTDDWLIWEGETRFGRYRRRVDFLSLNAGWFPAVRHELRLKTEWLAISAERGQRYLLQPGGNLLATGERRPNFDINNYGIQLRYRYLLGPQSDLFIAWSRGGFLRQERDQAGSLDLFDEALGLRDADQLLAKVRYRF